MIELKEEVVEKSHTVKDFVLRREHEEEYPMEIAMNHNEEPLIRSKTTVTEAE